MNESEDRQKDPSRKVVTAGTGIQSKPSVGRIVHYVSFGEGEHLAAIITKVYPPIASSGTSLKEPIGLHMFVTPEFARKIDQEKNNPNWGTGLPDVGPIGYSENKEPGTWHWPELV